MKRAFLVTVLLAVTGLVVAQEGPAPDQEQPQGQERPQGQGNDPGVAHISLIHGDVSMQRGDSGDWVATSLNTPVVGGDAISTSDGSRAEVQLDYANVLRLSGQTQAKIADLSRTHIQVQISQGFANLSTLRNSEAQVEVDTPNVSIHPAKNGRYRIEVNSDSETNVIVREGEAEISTPQGSTTVHEGELISIHGTDDPEYKVSEAPGSDDWDRWNKERDHVVRDAEGVRRTNPYYTGTHDLDTYGHWVNVPDYGEVWSPYDQPASWAPYQSGRWVWEPYYGWTWVSYEPWGWAPYHYGRWFVYGASWYWWPGPITPIYRPIWAPAFVSFVGFGPHVGFGFGFGSIGWCPLAPFEVFHPWWGVGFNRFSVVNINVFNRGFRDRDGFRGRGFSNLNLALSNPRVRGGITTVSAENFGRGAGSFGHGMDVGTLREARVATGNIGVVPTRESLAPSNRGFASAPAGIRSTASTRFFSRTQASSSMPSFRSETARMQEAVRSHGGEGQTMARAQSNTSGGFSRNDSGNSSRNGMQSTRSDRPGWSSFGRGQDSTGRSGSQGAGGQSQNNNPGGNRDGFHTFGSSSRGSQGGTLENRGGGGAGFPQNRSDRPSSSMGGSSRPQLDLNKHIVVPRGDSGSRNAGGFGGGNSGGRNNGGSYTGYSGSRGGNSGYSGGRNSGSGNSGGRNYSGGRSSSSGGGGRSSGGGNHGSSSHGGGNHR